MTLRQTFVAVGATLLFAGAAQAAGPANPDPMAIKGGTYAIESMHTRVLFSVSHMGFSTWYGDFTGVTGSVTVDPAHPAASKVSVTLPVASITTTNAKLDGELKNADWLDATGFPTASFVSRETRVTGPGLADVTGDFTLHGVTHPLTLHVKFNGAGANPMSKAYTLGFEATGSFHRSDYGVKRFVPIVGDEVELIISSAFQSPMGPM